MATIGPYTVLVFDGRLRLSMQKIAVLDAAPGADGVAVVKGGWTNPPQKVRTVTESTSATAAFALLTQYQALHGQIVTIVDQFGVTWLGVTIINVSGTIASAGYSSKWRTEVDWMVLPATSRPSGAA